MDNITEGDWEAVLSPYNYPYKYRIQTDKNIMALVYSEANARLIAASPDMQKALEAALPALRGIFDKNDNRPKHIKDRINLIVAALAKAEVN